MLLTTCNIYTNRTSKKNQRLLKVNSPFAMPIIGSLIKTALEINNQLNGLPEDAHQIQSIQLQQLLQQAKTTSFGKYYGPKLHRLQTLTSRPIFSKRMYSCSAAPPTSMSTSNTWKEKSAGSTRPTSPIGFLSE